MSIKAVVDRLESDKAVIITEDHQTLLCSKKNLPPDTKAGSVVFLQISQHPNATIAQEKLAKDLLNEIIQPGS